MADNNRPLLGERPCHRDFLSNSVGIHKTFKWLRLWIPLLCGEFLSHLRITKRVYSTVAGKTRLLKVCIFGTVSEWLKQGWVLKSIPPPLENLGASDFEFSRFWFCFSLSALSVVSISLSLKSPLIRCSFSWPPKFAQGFSHRIWLPRETFFSRFCFGNWGSWQ